MIHSDNSKSFCNQVTDELCRICGIEKTTSTPYHGQGNAIAGRVNSIVLTLLGVLPTNQNKFWQSMQILQHIVIIPLSIRQLDTLHSVCCLDGNLG